MLAYIFTCCEGNSKIILCRIKYSLKDGILIAEAQVI